MNTMRAVRVESCGGPEQMSVQVVPRPEPGPGEIRIRLSACGINLIDTYHRSGLYPLSMPTGLGCEGAGIVEVVGDGVDDLIVGDRVGFAMAMGAYAEAIVLARGAVVTSLCQNFIGISLYFLLVGRPQSPTRLECTA